MIGYLIKMRHEGYHEEHIYISYNDKNKLDHKIIQCKTCHKNVDKTVYHKIGVESCVPTYICTFLGQILTELEQFKDNL